jgi:hypothetical protein
MLGAIIIAVVIVVAIPVGVLMTSAVIAGFLGGTLRSDAAARHADSELLELNR